MANPTFGRDYTRAPSFLAFHYTAASVPGRD